MDLPDNNVLINAFRPDAPYHELAKNWLEKGLNNGQPLRLFPTVETGFLRVVTHPKIFEPPSPMAEACSFLKALCSSPSVEICPWTSTARHCWTDLCLTLGLNGNDCNDAMLAAIALDRGLRFVTFDQGFKRFQGLKCLFLAD